jgi:1-acyl-sn-glycerol-3-phosphate acyltransferase
VAAWPPQPGAVLRALATALLVSATALLLLPVGALTAFRARRLYSWIAAALARAVLAIYRVRVIVHAAEPLPGSQTVFVSNHTSTLDLFVLVALRLPSTRFFLSGFLRKVLPLGVIATMMGTFFTVPQDRPAERRRIFERAARVLRRTGESVYLSPEGGRIRSGAIGRFNKGAFHLATVLRAPIVPLYLQIPAAVDPGLGYDARPGVVHVHVLPPVETREWTVEDLDANVERVRDLFVRMHEEIGCA